MALDPAVVTAINNNSTDFTSAWNYLRANYPYMSVDDMATDIAASKIGAASSTTTTTTTSNSNSNSNGGGNVSISTLLGLPVGIAALSAMVGMPGNLIAEMGGGMLAAIAEYEVFDRAEKAEAAGTTANMAMLGLIYTGALFAMTFFLSKVWPDLFNFLPIPTARQIVIADGMCFPVCGATVIGHAACMAACVQTTAHAMAMAQFIHAMVIAIAVTSAVLVMGIFAGKPGSTGSSTSSLSNDIAGALKNAPAFYNSLPSASVALISMGLTLGGTAWNLSPGMSIQQFNASTFDLSAAATAAGSPGASIYINTSTEKSGIETVYVVNPGINADGTQTVSVFQIDLNGYLVGAKGPDQSYLPFAQPTGWSNGKATGYSINYGAFNALYQVPACTAIANDASLDAKTKEAALDTCLRNNKDVLFVPVGG